MNLPICVTVGRSTTSGIRLHLPSLGKKIARVTMVPSGEGLACIDGVWMRMDNLRLDDGQLLEVQLESV